MYIYVQRHITLPAEDRGCRPRAIPLSTKGLCHQLGSSCPRANAAFSGAVGPSVRGFKLCTAACTRVGCFRIFVFQLQAVYRLKIISKLRQQRFCPRTTVSIVRGQNTARAITSSCASIARRRRSPSFTEDIARERQTLSSAE